MENNTANEKRKVYALSYTAQDKTGYCAGVFDLYETLPRARQDCRSVVEQLKNSNYHIVIDQPNIDHIIMYNMNTQQEYHLFIDEKIIN